MKSRRIIFIFIIGITLILIIPFLINLAFKYESTHWFFIAEWSAGDLLGFYGSVLAGLLTIAGVYLSIQYAQKSYHEDVKHGVLPFLALSQYKVDIKSNLLSIYENCNDEQKVHDTHLYKEYKLSRLFFIINEESIDVKSELDPKIERIVKKGGHTFKFQGTVGTLVKEEYISIPMEIVNVGNGAAINIRYGLTKGFIECLYTLPQSLLLNELVYIHIFATDINDKYIGDYYLSFIYEDILRNELEQKFKLKIEKDENEQLYYEFCEVKLQDK